MSAQVAEGFRTAFAMLGLMPSLPLTGLAVLGRVSVLLVEWGAPTSTLTKEMTHDQHSACGERFTVFIPVTEDSE